MLIFVRQANGNGFQLEIQPNYSISYLFSFLREKIGCNTENFSLFFKGELIPQTHKSFADLNIKANDIIHMKWMTKKPDRQCLINVNIFYQHDIYSLRINTRQTVTKLKHKICDITHIHPKSQYLVFRGKKLSQNSTLNQEEIENDSLISLIVMERKELFQKYEEYFGYNERDLLSSITSLKIKRTESEMTKASKSSLFRSDSLGIKTNEEYSSPEIEVKYMRNQMGLSESIDSEMQLNRLFNICMGGGSAQQMTIEAITHGQQISLGGSYQFGSPKNKDLRFSKAQMIEEHQEHQQNQYDQENQQNEETDDKINLFESKYRTQSLYKKLQFDESYQSIEFDQTSPICTNLIPSPSNHELLNQLNHNPELVQ